MWSVRKSIVCNDSVIELFDIVVICDSKPPMKAFIALCFVFVLASVSADEHKAFKIHVQRAYEKVVKEAPAPKFDKSLNARATDCIVGRGESMDSCREDVEDYIEFLMATFKHNWVSRQFQDDVRTHLRQADESVKNLVVTESVQSVSQKELPVRPPTEEELRQYRQL